MLVFHYEDNVNMCDISTNGDNSSNSIHHNNDESNCSEIK